MRGFVENQYLSYYQLPSDSDLQLLEYSRNLFVAREFPLGMITVTAWNLAERVL